MVSDLYKQFYNKGLRPPLYFWRDINGRIEVDCLIDQGIKLIPLEIKSGETVSSSYFDALRKWGDISGTDPSQGYVIYGGTLDQSRSGGHLIGWQDAGDIVGRIEKSE